MLLAARRIDEPSHSALAAEAAVSLSGIAPLRSLPQPAEVDIVALLARCRDGDREALGELYRRYRPEAYRFIRHAVRHSEECEDILQEVFLEVAHSLRTYAGRSSFEGWLRSICVRTALRHLKRRRRQVGDSEDAVPRGSAAAEAAPDEDPGEGFERRERARRIQALLERLAPKKRVVLVLHDFEGIAPKDISRMVGAPVLTVRTRLFYARKELAALAAADPVLAVDLKPWLDDREGAP